MAEREILPLYKIQFLALDEQNRPVINMDVDDEDLGRPLGILERAEVAVSPGMLRLVDDFGAQIWTLWSGERSGSIAANPGMLTLIDKFGAQTWAPWSDVQSGDINGDRTSLYCVMIDKSFDQIRDLLDEIFGIETEAVVHIKGLNIQGGTIHIC